MSNTPHELPCLAQRHLLSEWQSFCGHDADDSNESEQEQTYWTNHGMPCLAQCHLTRVL